jgi:hypothetical protein
MARRGISIGLYAGLGTVGVWKLTDCVQIYLTYNLKKNMVRCIPIDGQLVGKDIPATHAHATTGYPLLGNGPVHTDP